MMNSLPSISITHKMYGWTKWGGPTNGLVKEELEEWYCQTCGEKQLKTFPSYMVPLDDAQRDFVRVCSACKAQANIKRVTFYSELVVIIKGI